LGPFSVNLMFSKKLVIIVCLILLALINTILLSISAKHCHGTADRVVIAGIGPLQEAVMRTIRFCEHTWSHYFYLVSLKQKYDHLERKFARARFEQSQYLESELTCERLRKLLKMKSSFPHLFVAAKVVGVDPSGWFKTIIINRGTDDGVCKGMPVIVPEGIVGQIVTSSSHYSKVMLIIDRSSAIDARVQRTRARGIVEGEGEQYCRFKYVLKKACVSVGDTVISSGLDRIFPKGLMIGRVEGISSGQSGIFQEVKIRPFVDFETLEEVMVIIR